MTAMVYNRIRENEYKPRRWKEGVVINLFKEGGRADPGNFRGITLLSASGKSFCKILNDKSRNGVLKERSIQRPASGF